MPDVVRLPTGTLAEQTLGHPCYPAVSQKANNFRKSSGAAGRKRTVWYIIVG